MSQPTVTYMLELSLDELLHLFALLELQTLRIEPDEESEKSLLGKIGKLLEGQ